MTNNAATGPVALASANLRAFLRTPKGLLLLVLLVLSCIAWPVEGGAAIARELAAVGAASLADTALFAWRGKQPEFPSSAILTGLIVAMVLSQVAPVAVVIAAALLAVASKHLLRFNRAHIFNPAAVGLLIVAIFGTAQSWWGGLGDLPGVATVALLLGGLVVATKVNKLPAILTFTGLYFALFTGAALAGNQLLVADVFHQPITGAALFFAFFMLTDPPTSPARISDQVWYAAVVAVVAFGAYLLTSGAVYYLPLALLAGNLLEAFRRTAGVRSRRPAAPTRPAAKRVEFPSVAAG